MLLQQTPTAALPHTRTSTRSSSSHAKCCRSQQRSSAGSLSSSSGARRVSLPRLLTPPFSVLLSAVSLPSSGTVRFLLASDSHLGYLEGDSIRCSDSFVSFEEALLQAQLHSVDFILLGGDLFHENKPSRSTLHRTMSLLRRYVLGSKPVSLPAAERRRAQLPADRAGQLRRPEPQHLHPRLQHPRQPRRPGRHRPAVRARPAARGRAHQLLRQGRESRPHRQLPRAHRQGRRRGRRGRRGRSGWRSSTAGHQARAVRHGERQRRAAPSHLRSA